MNWAHSGLLILGAVQEVMMSHLIGDAPNDESLIVTMKWDTYSRRLPLTYSPTFHVFCLSAGQH